MSDEVVLCCVEMWIVDTFSKIALNTGEKKNECGKRIGPDTVISKIYKQ